MHIVEMLNRVWAQVEKDEYLPGLLADKEAAEEWHHYL